MREHRGMEGHAYRDNDRDEPEEIQFIQELGLLGEVSEYLEQNDSVALKGIQMIRDELDGDIRLAALEVIIRRLFCTKRCSVCCNSNTTRRRRR